MEKLWAYVWPLWGWQKAVTYTSTHTSSIYYDATPTPFVMSPQMHGVYLGVRDPPDAPGALHRLRQLCSMVVAAFSEAGLLLSQDER